MSSTLVLTRRDVQELLGMDDCIAAVEAAFRLHAEGRSLSPGVLGVRAPEGGFHIKAAGLKLGRLYFAAKTNANFSGNPRRHGLPAIQGVIVLCDADNGCPLAVMDSMEVTARRTAAATAVAAKWLARPDASTVTVCGCGSQGREQLRALARVLPLRRAYAFDLDEAKAQALRAGPVGGAGLRGHAGPGPCGSGSEQRRVRDLYPVAGAVPAARPRGSGNVRGGGRRGQPRQAGAGSAVDGGGGRSWWTSSTSARPSGTSITPWRRAFSLARRFMPSWPTW